MTTVTVDSRTDKSAPVESRADLVAILPPHVAALAERELMADAGTAAALRLLALVDDPAWHEHVSSAHIGFMGMLDWSRRPMERPVRERVLVEVAASLYGDYHARPDLGDVVRWLPPDDFAAVLDALRIAREGLAA